ncbi:tryptophan 2,3-dioxygenase, partial [Oceanospirillaceae bacterium]|nr:tryptophan 2,3-dioxygenase [Oceanospirillaceae bacterium]
MTYQCPYASNTIDISDENIHWQQDISYGQYLGLESLLEQQNPLSEAHDEMLFIVIHQASELWMKLCLHEAHGAARLIAQDDLRPAFKMLTRVARIQQQMVNAWEVLVTMTPADYASFRDSLGQSSGFQSFQYRELEFLLGNKNSALIEAHRHHPKNYQHLTKVLNAPSLYDVCLQLLQKRGFDIAVEQTQRDWSQPYLSNKQVQTAWQKVYQDTDTFWDLYELAEKLVDLEYHFQQWRFNHVKTVERIIGHKHGTGGTSGVDYL